MGNPGTKVDVLVRAMSTALVCSALVLVACGSKEKPPGEWDTFSYPSDGFSVRAPVKPGQSESTIDTELGPSATRTYACSKLTDKGALIVMINDIEIPADADINEALHNGVLGNASTFGGQIVSENPLKQAGIPGTEYKIRGEHEEIGSIEVFGRAFYDKGKMFQIISLLPLGDEKYREKGQAFIASFEFLDAKADD